MTAAGSRGTAWDTSDFSDASGLGLVTAGRSHGTAWETGVFFDDSGCCVRSHDHAEQRGRRVLTPRVFASKRGTDEREAAGTALYGTAVSPTAVSWTGS